MRSKIDDDVKLLHRPSIMPNNVTSQYKMDSMVLFFGMVLNGLCHKNMKLENQQEICFQTGFYVGHTTGIFNRNYARDYI